MTGNMGARTQSESSHRRRKSLRLKNLTRNWRAGILESQTHPNSVRPDCHAGPNRVRERTARPVEGW